MNTFQLLYVSKPSVKIDTAEINRIVATANDFNSKNNITGILLFRAGVFLQLLEGEKSTVELLFEKIQKDPRHSHVVRIFGVEENERIFTNWAMGHHEISDLDIKMIGEFLSWNKLISAAKDLDNNIILHMLSRFKNVLVRS